MRHQSTVTLLLGLALASASAATFAHAGHRPSSGELNSPFVLGLLHTFGLDHLLSCLAAGVWGAIALSNKKQWLVPVLFSALLVVGALAGAGGFGLLIATHGISASLLLVAGMAALASTGLARPSWQLPSALGLLMIAALALVHGVMHAFETTASTQLAYTVGFGVSSVALILTGLSATRLYRARYEQSIQRRLECQQSHPIN